MTKLCNLLLTTRMFLLTKKTRKRSQHTLHLKKPKLQSALYVCSSYVIGQNIDVMYFADILVFRFPESKKEVFGIMPVFRLACALQTKHVDRFKLNWYLFYLLGVTTRVGLWPHWQKLSIPVYPQCISSIYGFPPFLDRSSHHLATPVAVFL